MTVDFVCKTQGFDQSELIARLMQSSNYPYSASCDNTKLSHLNRSEEYHEAIRAVRMID